MNRPRVIETMIGAFPVSSWSRAPREHPTRILHLSRSFGPRSISAPMLMRPVLALLGLVAVADAFQATAAFGPAARLGAARAVVSPLMVQEDVAAMSSRKAFVAAAALAFTSLPALAVSPQEFVSGKIVETFTDKPKAAVIAAEELQVSEALARKEQDKQNKADAEDRKIAREQRLAAEKVERAAAKAAKVAEIAAAKGN